MEFWSVGVIGGIGHGAISLPLVTTMMAQLLRRHSGLATGFALSGSTAGQLPVLTLLALLVTLLGWRGAYLGFGVALLALVPLAWIMLKGVGHEPRGRTSGHATHPRSPPGSASSCATGPSSC